MAKAKRNSIAGFEMFCYCPYNFCAGECCLLVPVTSNFRPLLLAWFISSYQQQPMMCPRQDSRTSISDCTPSMVNGHVEQDVNPGPNCSRQVFAVENEVHGLVRLGYSK